VPTASFATRAAPSGRPGDDQTHHERRPPRLRLPAAGRRLLGGTAAFLVDPPVALDGDQRVALGLSAIGAALVERDAATHVFDIVGREHYPTVAEFVDEVRQLGVSRRIPRTADFSRLSADSRLVLLHEYADVANALEFPTERRCPTEREEHLTAGYRSMCARLWWEEPLEAARHRLAIFAVFPIPQIEVIKDPTDGSHLETTERASTAGIPIVEVDQ
jgi:hypothetical protein